MSWLQRRVANWLRQPPCGCPCHAIETPIADDPATITDEELSILRQLADLEHGFGRDLVWAAQIELAGVRLTRELVAAEVDVAQIDLARKLREDQPDLDQIIERGTRLAAVTTAVVALPPDAGSADAVTRLVGLLEVVVGRAGLRSARSRSASVKLQVGSYSFCRPA